MANERIRHASLYIGGKKVATATGNSTGGDSGDESQIADEGYFGHTDGAMTSTISFDTIEPVRSSDSRDIVQAIKNKTYVQLGVGPIGGSIFMHTGRFKKYTFDSEAASGKLTGKFEFEGGEPEITG